ncbi:MAG: hypothetical protein K2H19_03280 [Ruminococcus sp.]|nr:hypothetical protein [Ruminococcus sp.]
MKKLFSATISAAMILSSTSIFSASAVESYGNDINITLLGDSIAEGYDLEKNEYNYGQIIADYLNGTVSNYAKAGDETSDTLAKISTASDISDADVVIISSGANDMIHYSSRFMLNMFANINALNDGYTADDIPEKPTFSEMMKMVDTNAVKEFTSNVINQMAINTELQKLRVHLTMKKENDTRNQYDCIIDTQIIPNIKKMVSEIKAINPNARIIVQTVYNPLQLDDDYLANLSDSYSQLLNIYIPTFKNVTKECRDRIMELDGVEIADVYSDFASTDANGNSYSWYFTGIQDSNIKDFKIHPNQAGHIAIATDILNILDKKNDDGGLLNLTYGRLKNKDNYPAAALENYKKFEGTYCIGDVTNDMIIDANDASEILATYSILSTNGTVSISESAQKAADVNSDTFIDSNDASEILAYYSYISTGETGSYKYFKNNK